MTKGFGGRFRSAARRLACTLAIVVGGVAILPFHAAAEGALGTTTAQVEVGTLPLLAALGIGIALAVGSVIAFLQMTVKGKGTGDPAQVPAEEIEPDEAGPDNGWNEQDPSQNVEYEDNPLTDYTIPVTRLLAQPDPAELADDDEPRLCGIGGEHAGTCYRVLDRRLSIGRDPSQCGIVFPYEAGEISRRHCTLRYSADSGLFFLEDHGSSNGTFLSNGERLEPGKVYELQAGDRFCLSGTEHWFEVRDQNRA